MINESVSSETLHFHVVLHYDFFSFTHKFIKYFNLILFFVKLHATKTNFNRMNEHFFRRESRNVNTTCRITFYCLPCVNFVTFCLPLPRTSRSKTTVVPNYKHEMHTENQDQSSLLAEMPRPRTCTNVNIYFYSFLLQKYNWMME